MSDVQHGTGGFPSKFCQHVLPVGGRTRWYRYVSIEISPSCTTSGGAISGEHGGTGMFP